MFYRITHLNSAPLPARTQIGGNSYELDEGGLLLEPPGTRESRPTGDGYAVLRLAWRPLDMKPGGVLAAAAEGYRWRDSETLEMSRTPNDSHFMLEGQANPDRTILSASIRAADLPELAVFTFIASPDIEIPHSWRGIFYHGAGLIGLARKPDTSAEQQALAAIEQYLAEAEPRLRQEAEARLERAWRAPA